MAYIDLGGTANAGANFAGQAGGTGSSSAGGQPNTPHGVSGSGAPGTNASIRNWVIAFYVIIALTLTGTGLLFNKHAK